MVRKTSVKGSKPVQRNRAGQSLLRRAVSLGNTYQTNFNSLQSRMGYSAATQYIQAMMEQQQRSVTPKATKSQQKENSTGLPADLKLGLENLSGYSMDDVKVHYNSDQPAQLQAHAYTQGTNIHLGSGQEKHLPHEAWHVVQQKQGRVKSTLQMKGGVSVNSDVGLESEADFMGWKALQFLDNWPASGDQGNQQKKANNGSQASQSGLIQLVPNPDAIEEVAPHECRSLGSYLYKVNGGESRDHHPRFQDGTVWSVHYDLGSRRIRSIRSTSGPMHINAWGVGLHERGWSRRDLRHWYQQKHPEAYPYFQSFMTKAIEAGE